MKTDVPSLLSGKSRPVLFTFSSLLIFICLIRSGVLVDRSFLPRLIMLDLTVLIFAVLFLRSMVRQKFTCYVIIFMIFCGWIFLSALWAQVPSETFVQAGIYSGIFLLFLIVRIIDDNFMKFFLILVMIFLYLGFVLAFTEIVELPFFDPYQIFSVSANNNLYSGLLLLCLAFLFMGYSSFNGILKTMMIIAGIISVFLLIILQSRAAYTGIAAALFLLLFLLITRYRHLIIRKHISAGIISIAAVAAGVIIFYNSLDTTRQNYFQSKIPVWNYFLDYQAMQEVKLQRVQKQADFTHMSEFDYAGNYYENANLRLIFWKKSLPLIINRPFTGTGAGNWKIIVPSVSQPPNPDHTLKNFTYSQPHNEWICFIAELGIPGFILALIVFLGPLVLILFRLYKSGNVPFFRIAAVPFIAGFYVNACFDFPFHRIEHMIMLFVLLGFLSGSNEITEPSVTGKFVIPVFLAITVFSLVVLIFRIPGEYFTLKMFYSERKDDARVIDYARKAENIFYHITPNALPVAWFEGVAQYRSGDTNNAAINFKKALCYTPYEVRVLNDYGISLYSLGKFSGGKEQLHKAYEIDPYFDDVKYNLAAIYYLSGRRDSAWYYLSRCRDSEKKSLLLKEMKMK